MSVDEVREELNTLQKDINNKLKSFEKRTGVNRINILQTEGLGGNTFVLLKVEIES